MAMEMMDADLLDRYRNAGSTAAFDELVRRHIDLVYSVARRHVRSSHLAEEVAQHVFLELARRARDIRAAVPLVAWLHVVSRRTAIDLVRQETRRRSREQAAIQLETMHESNPHSEWHELEPLLDEAIAALRERDRAAVLLRYFENKSLREVGAAFGASEDAAQKLVTRSLDQLRSFFSRRGVSVTSAGLLTHLSTQAVQSAPAALSRNICAAVSHAAVVLPVSSLTALTMTSVQKIIVAAVLTLAATGGIYQAWVIRNERDAVRTLQQQARDDSRALGALQRERNELAHRVADLSERLTAAQNVLSAASSSDPAIEEALDSWLQRVVQLKQHLEHTPSLHIPELQLLEAKDWLDATKESKLEHEMDYRAALNTLRQAAKHRLFAQFGPAVFRYCEANDRRPPTDLTAQVLPYFEKPVDPTMLQRYAVYPVAELGGGEWPKNLTNRHGQPVEWVIRERHPVDDYFDSTFWASEDGYGLQGTSTFDRELNTAIETFRQANNGVKPTDPAQLSPYLDSAIDPVFIHRRLANLR